MMIGEYFKNVLIIVSPIFCSIQNFSFVSKSSSGVNKCQHCDKCQCWNQTLIWPTVYDSVCAELRTEENEPEVSQLFDHIGWIKLSKLKS